MTGRRAGGHPRALGPPPFRCPAWRLPGTPGCARNDREAGGPSPQVLRPTPLPLSALDPSQQQRMPLLHHHREEEVRAPLDLLDEADPEAGAEMAGVLRGGE